jgi:branched-chain amino acid transport system substrate-binding protein
MMRLPNIYRHSRESGNPEKIGDSRFRGNDGFLGVIACTVILFFTPLAHAEIFIGVAGPLTGTYASFGAQMVAGVEAAVDDLNVKGGIEGQLLEVVTEDDGCDNRLADVAAQNLIAKNVRVVIGHFCSYPSLVAAKRYEAAGIPMIAPSPSLPALTDATLFNVLRLSTRDDAQGAFAAQRMQQDFTRDKIATVSDGSAAATALLASFSAAFSGSPPMSLSLKPGAADFASLVTALKAENISALYCACSASDAGELASELGGSIKIFGPDALLVPQFWEKSGAAGEDTRVSFARDPQSLPEAKALLRTLTIADGATLPSYAAVQLFAAAAAEIGSQNGKNLVAYLRSGKTFSTVMGGLAFDGKGDLRQQNFVWYRWSGGSYSAEP